jgi:EmrB/QacA subfamily drug resistance transporter
LTADQRHEYFPYWHTARQSKKGGNPLNRGLSRFATFENRWYALIFIALGLAIVIIDNTILNVSIPYMLRDLDTTLPALEWAISGYSLTMATILITVGRVGDIFGRKRLFVIGMVIFATGSLMGSLSRHVTLLIVGRAIIQAIGAATVLTSALALIAAGFQGRERTIAFGIWGAVAGSSATIGPLLGGYLTAYYSWRWSFRINIFIALAAIIGSILIRTSRSEGHKEFDWPGTAFSAAGLFCLVFGFIEGRKYGWLRPNETFTLFGASWPLGQVSVIPFFFLAALIFLTLFVRTQARLERRGGAPLFRLSMFRSRGFSLGMATLLILAFGQFGIFFVMPIYLENVLGLNAFHTGLFLLPVSISLFVLGFLSGFLAARFSVKWIVVAGMAILAVGAYLIRPLITVDATVLSMAPGLITFGIGFGLSGSQMNNVILSSASVEVAGEASAGSITMRQVGASIGVAVIGAVLATTLTTNVSRNIESSKVIPPEAQGTIVSQLSNVDVESGQGAQLEMSLPPAVAGAVKKAVDRALVSSAQATTLVAFFFILGGALLTVFLPPIGTAGRRPVEAKQEAPPEAEDVGAYEPDEDA